MRLDRLTTKFQEALADAQSLAVGKDNPTVEPAHVLLAMLKQGEGSVRGVISKAGGNPQVLVKGAEAEVNNLPQVANNAGQIQIGSKLQAALNLTDKEAQKRGDQFIASELFLLACLQDSTGLAKVMKEAGLNAQSLNTAIEQVRGGAAVDSADGESQREALKKYTIDLTERARMGKLDPVIGRDDEIRRAIQILQRRTKNNPVNLNNIFLILSSERHNASFSQ